MLLQLLLLLLMRVLIAAAMFTAAAVTTAVIVDVAVAFRIMCSCIRMDSSKYTRTMKLQQEFPL